MASTYLSMTGTGDAKKWTFSGWFKKALNGSEQRLITSSDNSTYDDNIRFNSDDTITIRYRNAVVLKTNRKFRDNNAYYHIVVKVDTDQSTANDRVVLYINGVDERTVGGYGTDSMPGQGLTGYLNYNVTYIGFTNPSANSNHFNGIMSHVHFTDGYAYDASAFGSTDSTTGEWKINTSPSVTYGANGFFILKDGNSVTDQSGEGNDFTVGGGTLTKTEDCPSNVFATFQPLDLQASTQTFAEGNLKVTTDSSGWDTIASTIGGTSGKWYFEAKLITLGNYAIIGVIDINDANLNTTSSYYIGASTPDNGYQNNGARPDTGGGFGASYTANDIIGIAIDMDNLKVYFSKNGTFQNSGNPTSGATGTGAQDLTASTTYCFAISGHGSTVWEANFGSPPFAISSGNTDGNDRGNFEYAVPSGYLSLCTANLSEVLG